MEHKRNFNTNASESLLLRPCLYCTDCLFASLREMKRRSWVKERDDESPWFWKQFGLFRSLRCDHSGLTCVGGDYEVTPRLIFYASTFSDLLFLLCSVSPFLVSTYMFSCCEIKINCVWDLLQCSLSFSPPSMGILLFFFDIVWDFLWVTQWRDVRAGERTNTDWKYFLKEYIFQIL